jgi:NAD(P)-dependent dehydrogenase (short-subunit alcohol dehydrogenase family)
MDSPSRTAPVNDATYRPQSSFLDVGRAAFDRVHSFGSKPGIEGVVRQLATEFGPDGIRVNGLAPGLIDEWARVVGDVADATPLGRPGRVDGVTDADAGVALIQSPSTLEPLVRQIHVTVADGDPDGRQRPAATGTAGAVAVVAVEARAVFVTD